ncbi:ABC-three component system protein [Clostridiisalibacter paucivorans]|uniref:ABC-three component system protein n=1 Tax=Clostridiisalibacter paucivorans TaxID=408753 RepID=UPI00047A55C9|nr:ABC-three component system protein [Clostridiisalibacter paucivorans]
MMEKLMQLLLGDNNNVAGRDIIKKEYHYDPHPIRFYEKDIEEIILCFSEEIKEMCNIIEKNDDFYRPNIEEKNRINNLTERYFKYIQKNSLNHFHKIESFLYNIRNKEYLKKYLSTANELNNKIICNRNQFEYFEKIFDVIYNYIVENNDYNLKCDKNLIWIFLHYMYYNCDIGDKYDKTT